MRSIPYRELRNGMVCQVVMGNMKDVSRIWRVGKTNCELVARAVPTTQDLIRPWQTPGLHAPGKDLQLDPGRVLCGCEPCPGWANPSSPIQGSWSGYTQKCSEWLDF